MGCLLWHCQFLSLILFHLHFHATISSSFSSIHLCSLDQSLALLHFKESFSIDSSASSEACQFPKTLSWEEGTDCCSWDGVTCDMETGQVIELDLASSMLYGTLHSSNILFSLQHLQKLDLSDNYFNSSHISSQFGQLSNLTHLNLSSSFFNGQVASEMSHLSKLVSLDLSGNYYLSIEPISFNKLVQNLTKLEHLDLTYVNMSFLIPNSLRNLSSSLSSLKLSYCGLRGEFPDNILWQSNLQVLNLWGNTDLTGSFSSSNVSSALSALALSETRISIRLEHDLIDNLKAMKTLYLRSCNLVGSNLALFGNLTKLTVLDLSNNMFGGHIPFSFGKFEQLRELFLGFNNFIGPIPYDFEQLTELVSLDLSGNYDLTVEPISFNKLVQNLTMLRKLDLSYVNMSLVVPRSLMNLSSSLSSLSLEDSKLQGEFPVGNILLRPNLESLNLEGNVALTGSFPSSNVSRVLTSLGLSATGISIYLEKEFFINLKSLKQLYLAHCNIIRSNLALLGNLTQLSRLELSNNNFGDQIPTSLGSLEHLTSLSLKNNKFTGRIPESLGNLTQLHGLDLSYNGLVDPIPSRVSNLSNLLNLLLNDNLLKGTIPFFLFTLPSLRIFDLHNNLFTGTISQFHFNSLQYIDLRNNELHGRIPSLIFKQQNLLILNLASNDKLTGEIPSSVCELKFLSILDLSNNSLSGSIPQC